MASLFLFIIIFCLVFLRSVMRTFFDICYASAVAVAVIFSCLFFIKKMIYTRLPFLHFYCVLSTFQQL